MGQALPPTTALLATIFPAHNLQKALFQRYMARSQTVEPCARGNDTLSNNRYLLALCDQQINGCTGRIGHRRSIPGDMGIWQYVNTAGAGNDQTRQTADLRCQLRCPSLN